VAERTGCSCFEAS